MAQETKFGLVLVLALTGAFGVMVWKRLHHPKDLVARTDGSSATTAATATVDPAAAKRHESDGLATDGTGGEKTGITEASGATGVAGKSPLQSTSAVETSSVIDPFAKETSSTSSTPLAAIPVRTAATSKTTAADQAAATPSSAGKTSEAAFEDPFAETVNRSIPPRTSAAAGTGSESVRPSVVGTTTLPPKADRNGSMSFADADPFETPATTATASASRTPPPKSSSAPPELVELPSSRKPVNPAAELDPFGFEPAPKVSTSPSSGTAISGTPSPAADSKPATTNTAGTARATGPTLTAIEDDPFAEPAAPSIAPKASAVSVPSTRERALAGSSAVSSAAGLPSADSPLATAAPLSTSVPAATPTSPAASSTKPKLPVDLDADPFGDVPRAQPAARSATSTLVSSSSGSVLPGSSGNGSSGSASIGSAATASDSTLPRLTLPAAELAGPAPLGSPVPTTTAATTTAAPTTASTSVAPENLPSVSLPANAASVVASPGKSRSTSGVEDQVPFTTPPLSLPVPVAKPNAAITGADGPRSSASSNSLAPEANAAGPAASPVRAEAIGMTPGSRSSLPAGQFDNVPANDPRLGGFRPSPRQEARATATTVIEAPGERRAGQVSGSANAALDLPVALPIEPASRTMASASVTPPRSVAIEGSEEVLGPASRPRSLAPPAMTDTRPQANFDPGMETAVLTGDSYVVQPNDSFWQISKRVYGTPRYAAALAKYNVASVPNPANLRPGVTIATPAAAELESRYRELLPASSVAAPVVEPTAVGLTGDTYTIVDGDNFWEISKKVYGTGKYFQALSTYNAALIGNGGKLKAGQKLATPPVETLAARFPKLIGQVAPQVAAIQQQQPERFQPEQPKGFFVSPDGAAWYRVGAEDTLSGIARNHLGRSSRWVQIWELNQDVLKDGNTLSVGLVLRLPSDASGIGLAPEAAPDR